MKICRCCGVNKDDKHFYIRRDLNQIENLCNKCRHTRSDIRICDYCGKKYSANRSIFCSLKCRFLSNIKVINNDCWVQTRRNPLRFCTKVNGKKIERSTRDISYELHCGKIPMNKKVIASCGFKNCCNPEHLTLIDSHVNHKYINLSINRFIFDKIKKIASETNKSMNDVVVNILNEYI